MLIKRLRLLAVILLIFPLSGCWDRRELNDRLFELGSGVDQLEDEKVLMIGQFMIPTKSGESSSGEKQSYFIETGIGKDAFDGLFDMQLKLSRRITRGHRHNIYIGEKMAMSGISNLLDSVTRDPDSRFRSDIWVVKGTTALEFMQMSFPLEKMPAIALSKLREIIGKRVGNSVLEILIEENVEGSGPTLPAVEIIYDSKLRKKTLHVYGRAVLNRKQQLAGYYNAMESAYRLWVVGETKRMPISVSMSNQKGTFSVEVQRTTCKVLTEVDDGRVEIDVNLKGNAIVQESNTALDLRNDDHLLTYETELNNHVETAILDVIQKAQKQFKVDVFHFGKAVSRQHPEKWEELNSQWEQAFSNAKITVHSHVKIKQIGLQGPPPNIQ
ncbi:Ger(x)C family spore germination protein [Paenibacillus sp. 5J-6]|uniref:Ger(X)C family spore germination protein n=1 Tax=Paenibacillus silvestris TaxID=2606219 RepID=A0A6L8UT86_9BACL|nr:Ger(x)C family spore germination protein [Paenibacillus silvestris]MZQ81333.1 Ger(x)C family spore germination protein [Paenibacillus silvestris]